MGEAKQWGVEITAPLWEGRWEEGREERSLPLPSSSGQQEPVRATGRDRRCGGGEKPGHPGALISCTACLCPGYFRGGARLAPHHPGWEGGGWAGEDQAGSALEILVESWKSRKLFRIFLGQFAVPLVNKYKSSLAI